MAFVKILFVIFLLQSKRSYHSVEASCECWHVHDFTSSTEPPCVLSIPSIASASSIKPLLSKQGVTINSIDTSYYDSSPGKERFENITTNPSFESDYPSFGFGRQGGGPDAIFTISIPQKSSVEFKTCFSNDETNMVNNAVLSVYNSSCLHTSYAEMSNRLISSGTDGFCQNQEGRTWTAILDTGNYTLVAEQYPFESYDPNSYPRNVKLTHTLRYQCPCGYTGDLCESNTVPFGFQIGAPMSEGTVIATTNQNTFSDFFDIDIDGNIDALFSLTIPYSNMDLTLDTCDKSGDPSITIPNVAFSLWQQGCFATDMDPTRDITDKYLLNYPCNGGLLSKATMIEAGNYSLAYRNLQISQNLFPFSLSWRIQCSCGYYNSDCSKNVNITTMKLNNAPSLIKLTSITLLPLPMSFLTSLSSTLQSSYGSLIKLATSSDKFPIPANIIVTGLCPIGLIVRAFSSTLTSEGECFRQGSVLNEIQLAKDLNIVTQSSTSYIQLVKNAWKFLVSANGTSSFQNPNLLCTAVFHPGWTNVVPVFTSDIYLLIQDKTSRSRLDLSWSASCPCYTFGDKCSTIAPVKISSSDKIFSTEAFEDTAGRYTFNNDAGFQTAINNTFGGSGLLSFFALTIPQSRSHIQKILVTTCHPETTVETQKIFLSLSCPAGGNVDSAAYLDIQSVSMEESGYVRNCAFATLHFSGSASLDANTNAIHVLVSANKVLGESDESVVGLYYAFQCECGYGGSDCSSPILPGMYTRVSSSSSSSIRSTNSNIVSAYSRGEFNFDTGNASIAIDILGGIGGKETFFNLSIPFGLPGGTKLHLHSCATAMFGSWPIMWLIVSERASQCLAGGVSMKEYSLVLQSENVEQGCAQIEIIDPLPANYILVLSANNFKGKVHFDLICPCGYAGPLCERIPRLPAIPADLPSSGEIRGSTTNMQTLTVTTGESTSYQARYELNLNVPALLSLSTCNYRSMFGFDGKKGIGTTLIQLFALCTDSGVPVDVSSEEFPTEFYVNEDRYYYASDTTGQDVYAQCYQASGSFDPGLYHLVVSSPQEGIDGVFSVDYSVSFPCPCGQLGPTCTDEPVSIEPLLGFGGIVKGNVGAANNQSVYDSSYFTISTPGDFNASTMSISLDVCNSYTFDGAFDLELHLYSRCIAGGQSGQVVALAHVPLAGAVLADVISADSPTAQGMCGKGILAGLGSRLETGILTLEAGKPPYTEILDKNPNAHFRGNQIYGIEVRPGPGTSGGAFELAYRVACRCGLYGEGCMSHLPVIHATTVIGVDNNVDRFFDDPSAPIMFLSDIVDPDYPAFEAYFSYSVKSSGNLPPAMLNLTLCTFNNIDGDGYSISLSLFGPWGCPAGFRLLDSSNPIEKKVSITSSGENKACVSAAIFPVYAYTNVWALLQTQKPMSDASLSWEASCPCFYYGENCGSLIPYITLENETMSLVPTYSGRSEIVTSESMIDVFGKQGSFEVVFIWPFPVETMRTASFHMESLSFSTCSEENNVTNEDFRSNGWAAQTAIYVIAGCISGAYKESPFFPVGAGPRSYGHIFDQAPSFFKGPYPSNPIPCSSLTLNKKNLIDSFMADVNLTIIIESLKSDSGKMQLSWEYVCDCDWAGPGCALPISITQLSWTSTSDTAVSTMYSNKISWQPAGLQTDVFGSRAGDKVFSMKWDIATMQKQEWIRISACFRNQRIGNKTIAFDNSKIAIHVLRKSNIQSDTSVSCLGGGRQRSAPDGALVASFPNAIGELTREDESINIVKINPLSAEMTICNWAIEIPRPTISTDYFVVVEDTSLNPDPTITIDLTYRKSCMCGYGGSDCSTPLSLHELSTSSGSLTVSLPEPQLIDGLGFNGSFSLARMKMPNDEATIAGNTSFRVSTCNIASAYGVRDTVIRAFSTCFGGGRDMIEIHTFKPPFSNDDTDDCSYATLYSKPVTAPRSQLTNRRLEGNSLASFAGKDLYIMLQSFDMFHYGIIQLDYTFTCSPYIFGDSSLSSCFTQGTVSSLPFQSLAGTGQISTTFAAKVPGFSRKVSLYEIKAVYDHEQHREPPAWTSISICNLAGNNAIRDVKKSNQTWSGFVDRLSVSNQGSCHSTSFAPLTTSVNVAVEVPDSPASSYSINWKVSCDCHYDSINISAPSCSDLMYSVLGDLGTSKIMWPYTIIDSGSVDVYSNEFGPFDISTGLGGGRNLAIGFGVNRWNGPLNSNSPEIVATFANPSLDVNSQIGNYQDSAHNEIALLILSTCYPGTTAGGGDTRMWAMKKCVAGTSDKEKTWYPSLESLGIMQYNDDIDSDILAMYFPKSTINTKCSALVFRSDILDNLDYRYLDFVMEAKENNPTGTIEYGLQFICKCGMFGYDCKTEGASVTHVVSWDPLSHTSIYEFDPQEGQDLWKTPQDTRSKNDQILLYTIPEHVKSVVFTTCDDSDTINKPNGQLYLFKGESSSIDYPCFAGGESFNRLPLLSSSYVTNGSSCGTIYLTQSLVGAPSIKGDYRLFVTTSGDSQFDYLKFKVRAFRECECGWGGKDCTITSTTETELIGLSGTYIGSTVSSPLSLGASSLFRWTTSAGSGKPTIVNGISLGGSGNTSVLKLTVSLDSIAALEIHTCHPITRDGVSGLVRTFLGIYKSECGVGLGTTPESIASNLIAANDGSQDKPTFGPCSSDTFPTRIEFTQGDAIQQGTYTVAVTGYGSLVGRFGLSYYQRCKCNLLGPSCTLAAPASPSIIDSNFPIGNAAGGIVGNLTLNVSPSSPLLNLEGLMVPAWMFQINLLKEVSLDKQEIRVSTCDLVKKDVSKKAPLTIGLAPFNSVCFASGTSLSKYSSTMLATPSSSLASCSDMTFSPSLLTSTRNFSLFLAYASSAAPSSGTFLAEYYAGCKCGLFTSTCESAREIRTLNPNLVTISSISTSVPNPVEWTQAFQDQPIFWSGHAYLMVKVPVNSVSTTITTCTLETASSIIDTHLRISFRCPSASTYIEGNEYLIDSNDDISSGVLCSTVFAGPEAASNTIYAVVQGGIKAEKDINKRTFGATVTFGCACGWSGPFCDIPAIPLTLNLPEQAIDGNTFNFSWTINKATAGAMTALTYLSGEEYLPLLLEVHEHTSSVLVSTCNTVTQENVRNALLYTASSSPSLYPTSLDGATQAVCTGVSILGSKELSDNTRGDAYCTPWQKLSYSGSMQGYQLLITTNGKFDISSSSVFGIISRVQCNCDWGDGFRSGCSAPFGVRVGCTDTRKNIVGSALCAPSGRLTFPSSWPNVFGYIDGSMATDEPAAVIALSLSDNAEGYLPSSVTISTDDPATRDKTTGLGKTSMWVYKGCARGGVPLREQTWTLVANSTDEGVFQFDHSIVTLSNPTDRIYYVVIKGRKKSTNAGKMKQFGLVWTQILPTPSPSSIPTYRAPSPSRSTTSSISHSPTPSPTPRAVVKVDLRLDGIPMSILTSSECVSKPLTCPLLYLRRGVSVVTKESLSDVSIDSIMDSETGSTMSINEGSASNNPIWRVSQVLSRRLHSLYSHDSHDRFLQKVGPGSTTSFSITSRSTSSDAIAGSMKRLSTNTTVAAFLDALGPNGLLFKNAVAAKGYNISSIGSTATIYAPGQASANPTPSVTPSPRYIITIPGGVNVSSDGSSTGTVIGAIGGVVGVLLVGALGYYIRSKTLQKKILIKDEGNIDDEGVFEGENIHAGKAHISNKSRKKSTNASKRKENKKKSASSAIAELSAAAIDAVGGAAAILSSPTTLGQGFSAVSVKEAIPDIDADRVDFNDNDDDDNDIGRGRIHQKGNQLFDVEDDDVTRHIPSSNKSENGQKQKIDESKNINSTSGTRRESALGLLSRRRNSSIHSIGSVGPIMPTKLFPSAWGEKDEKTDNILVNTVETISPKDVSSSITIKSESKMDPFVASPIVVVEGEESDDSDTEVDIYSGMGLPELKDECVSRLLSTSTNGRKPSQELRRRLRMDDELAVRRAAALKAKETAAQAKKAALEKLAAAKESKRVAAEKVQRESELSIQLQASPTMQQQQQQQQPVVTPTPELSVLSSVENVTSVKSSVSIQDDIFDQISKGLFSTEEDYPKKILPSKLVPLQVSPLQEDREKEINVSKQAEIQQPPQQQERPQSGFSFPSFFSSTSSDAATNQRPQSAHRPLSATNWFRTSSEKIVPLSIPSVDTQKPISSTLLSSERPATAQALTSSAKDRPDRDVLQVRPTTSSNIAIRAGTRSLAPMEQVQPVESHPRKGGWGEPAQIGGSITTNDSMQWSPSTDISSSQLDRVNALDESADFVSAIVGAPTALSPVRNVKKKMFGRNELDDFNLEGGQHEPSPFSLGWVNGGSGARGTDLLSRDDNGLKPLVITKTVSSAMLIQSSVTVPREELKPVVTHKTLPTPQSTYKDDEIVIVQDAEDMIASSSVISKPKKKKKKRVDAFVAEVSTFDVDEIDK